MNIRKIYIHYKAVIVMLTAIEVIVSGFGVFLTDAEDPLITLYCLHAALACFTSIVILRSLFKLPAEKQQPVLFYSEAVLLLFSLSPLFLDLTADLKPDYTLFFMVYRTPTLIILALTEMPLLQFSLSALEYISIILVSIAALVMLRHPRWKYLLLKQ